jgi:NADH-quinone oxidoreductase subunit M
MFSSIGLPGLNGFIGEFLIMLGAFDAVIQKGVAGTSVGLNWLIMIVAVSGVVLGAVYMLWMYQRVIFGPLKNEENKKLTDLSSREVLVFAPLLAMMLVMGLYPKPFLDRMEKSVTTTLARAEAKRIADASRFRLAQETSTASTVSRKAATQLMLYP